MKKYFLVFGILLLLFSCAKQPKPNISFYYWKTTYSLSEVERQTLKENNVKKMYIRYFDIGLSEDGTPFPVTAIQFRERPGNFEIVPVIYIKNQVFTNPKVDLKVLAKNALKFVEQIDAANKLSSKEIQIDCDWTLSSRDNYLRFVDILNEICDKKLSATIRLHQVKYFRKTKIPNVDYGVLMYYNMGKIAPDEKNAIYDRKIAEQYLSYLENYPLRLDVALPIYSAAIHIRNGNVIGLKNKSEIKNIKNDTLFLEVKKGWFKSITSHYQAGTFYRTGDLLKIETVSAEQLFEMADDISTHSMVLPTSIIFYELDEINLKSYEKNIFQKVADRF